MHTNLSPQRCYSVQTLSNQTFIYKHVFMTIRVIASLLVGDATACWLPRAFDWASFYFCIAFGISSVRLMFGGQTHKGITVITKRQRGRQNKEVAAILWDGRGNRVRACVPTTWRREVLPASPKHIRARSNGRAIAIRFHSKGRSNFSYRFLQDSSWMLFNLGNSMPNF